MHFSKHHPFLCSIFAVALLGFLANMQLSIDGQNLRGYTPGSKYDTECIAEAVVTEYDTNTGFAAMAAAFDPSSRTAYYFSLKNPGEYGGVTVHHYDLDAKRVTAKGSITGETGVEYINEAVWDPARGLVYAIGTESIEHLPKDQWPRWLGESGYSHVFSRVTRIWVYNPSTQTVEETVPFVAAPETYNHGVIVPEKDTLYILGGHRYDRMLFKRVPILYAMNLSDRSVRIISDDVPGGFQFKAVWNPVKKRIQISNDVKNTEGRRNVLTEFDPATEEFTTNEPIGDIGANIFSSKVLGAWSSVYNRTLFFRDNDGIYPITSVNSDNIAERINQPEVSERSVGRGEKHFFDSANQCAYFYKITSESVESNGTLWKMCLHSCSDAESSREESNSSPEEYTATYSATDEYIEEKEVSDTEVWDGDPIDTHHADGHEHEPEYYNDPPVDTEPAPVPVHRSARKTDPSQCQTPQFNRNNAFAFDADGDGDEDAIFIDIIQQDQAQAYKKAMESTDLPLKTIDAWEGAITQRPRIEHNRFVVSVEQCDGSFEAVTYGHDIAGWERDSSAFEVWPPRASACPTLEGRTRFGDRSVHIYWVENPCIDDSNVFVDEGNGEGGSEGGGDGDGVNGTCVPCGQECILKPDGVAIRCTENDPNLRCIMDEQQGCIGYFENDPLPGPDNDPIESECGNGEVDAGEQCDDGNDDNTDFCLNDCTENYALECETGVDCPDPEEDPTESECGDGVVSGDEECDVSHACPGGGDPDAGLQLCTQDCRCGDTPYDPVGDSCGDGPIINQRQCESLEWQDWNSNGVVDCSSTCSAAEVEDSLCGNGVLDPGEDCDHMHIGCKDQAGEYSCPETCLCGRGVQETECGNGVVEEGEDCDDGNSDNGDGCSASCGVEQGWECEHSDGIVAECSQSYRCSTDDDCMQYFGFHQSCMQGEDIGDYFTGKCIGGFQMAAIAIPTGTCECMPTQCGSVGPNMAGATVGGASKCTKLPDPEEDPEEECEAEEMKVGPKEIDSSYLRSDRPHDYVLTRSSQYENAPEFADKSVSLGFWFKWDGGPIRNGTPLSGAPNLPDTTGEVKHLLSRMNDDGTGYYVGLYRYDNNTLNDTAEDSTVALAVRLNGDDTAMNAIGIGSSAKVDDQGIVQVNQNGGVETTKDHAQNLQNAYRNVAIGVEKDKWYYACISYVPPGGEQLVQGVIPNKYKLHMQLTPAVCPEGHACSSSSGMGSSNFSPTQHSSPLTVASPSISRDNFSAFNGTIGPIKVWNIGMNGGCALTNMCVENKEKEKKEFKDPDPVACPITYPCPNDEHCKNLPSFQKQVHATKPNGEEVCVRVVDECTQEGRCKLEETPCGNKSAYNMRTTLKTNNQLESCFTQEVQQLKKEPMCGNLVCDADVSMRKCPVSCDGTVQDCVSVASNAGCPVLSCYTSDCERQCLKDNDLNCVPFTHFRGKDKRHYYTGTAVHWPELPSYLETKTMYGKGLYKYADKPVKNPPPPFPGGGGTVVINGKITQVNPKYMKFIGMMPNSMGRTDMSTMMYTGYPSDVDGDGDEDALVYFYGLRTYKQGFFWFENPGDGGEWQPHGMPLVRADQIPRYDPKKNQYTTIKQEYWDRDTLFLPNAHIKHSPLDRLTYNYIASGDMDGDCDSDILLFHQHETMGSRFKNSTGTFFWLENTGDDPKNWVLHNMNVSFEKEGQLASWGGTDAILEKDRVLLYSRYGIFVLQKQGDSWDMSQRVIPQLLGSVASRTEKEAIRRIGDFDGDGDTDYLHIQAKLKPKWGYSKAVFMENTGTDWKTHIFSGGAYDKLRTAVEIGSFPNAAKNNASCGKPNTISNITQNNTNNNQQQQQQQEPQCSACGECGKGLFNICSQDECPFGCEYKKGLIGGSCTPDPAHCEVNLKKVASGPVCGNGKVEKGELCDGGDGCLSNCMRSNCFTQRKIGWIGTDIDWGDIDGDGDIDILSKVSGTYYWREQKQNNKWKEHKVVDGFTHSWEYYEPLGGNEGVGKKIMHASNVITLIDIDKDGDKDIVTDDLGFMENKGWSIPKQTVEWDLHYAHIVGDSTYDPINRTKYFRDTYLYGTSNSGYGPASVFMDINNDGWTDVVQFLPHTKYPVAFINPQAPFTKSWKKVEFTEPLWPGLEHSFKTRTAWYTPVAIDLDGDGDKDLVFSYNSHGAAKNNVSKKIYSSPEKYAPIIGTIWYENPGGSSGKWKWHKLLNRTMYSFLEVDIDNSGTPGFIAHNTNRPGTIWMQNEGGTWKERELPKDIDAVLLPFDANGDGEFDMLTNRCWARKKQDGTWAPCLSDGGLNSISHLKVNVSRHKIDRLAIDVNDDGRTDIMTNSKGGKSVAEVSWFENTCLDAPRKGPGVECADGHLDLPEECDDGNKVDGDGCSSGCKIEGCYNGPTVERTWKPEYVAGWTNGTWSQQQRTAYVVSELGYLVRIDMANDTSKKIDMPIRYRIAPNLQWYPKTETVYLFGGGVRGKSGNVEYIDHIYALNTKTDTVQKVGALPTTRHGATAVHVPTTDRIYLFGGASKGGKTWPRDTIVFNPNTNAAVSIPLSEPGANGTETWGPYPPIIWNPVTDKLLFSGRTKWVQFDPHNLLTSRKDFNPERGIPLNFGHDSHEIFWREGANHIVNIGYTSPQFSNPFTRHFEVPPHKNFGKKEGDIGPYAAGLYRGLSGRKYVNQRGRNAFTFYDTVSKRAHVIGGTGRDIFGNDRDRNKELLNDTGVMLEVCLDRNCCL